MPELVEGQTCEPSGNRPMTKKKDPTLTLILSLILVDTMICPFTMKIVHAYQTQKWTWSTILNGVPSPLGLLVFILLVRWVFFSAPLLFLFNAIKQWFTANNFANLVTVNIISNVLVITPIAIVMSVNRGHYGAGELLIFTTILNAFISPFIVLLIPYTRPLMNRFWATSH